MIFSRRAATGVLVVISFFGLARSVNATEDGCAIVLKTPDGFLNMRRAPTMKSDIVTQLKQGDFLYVDTAGCETAGTLTRPGKQTRESALPRKRQVIALQRNVARGQQQTHAAQQIKFHHSITSSARPSSVIGNVRLSVFAVLRLITSPIFTACITGRSASLAPLRIFPV
jgi:hypothetical protein